MSEEHVELDELCEVMERALRRPPIEEDEAELEQLVVQLWLERGAVAQEVLGEELTSRAAWDAVVSWQALGRMGAEAPLAEARAEVREALHAALTAHQPGALGEAAHRLCNPEDVAEKFGLFFSGVGSPGRWTQAVAQEARELIEAVDEHLLYEAGALELALPWSEDDQDACAALFMKAMEGVACLVPAQAYVRAVAATLRLDMEVAPGSYPLWLELMEEREGWALQDAVVRHAVAAYESATAPQGGEVMDLAVFRARRDAALAGRSPGADELAPELAPALLAAADAGEQYADPEWYWEGESGWSVSLRAPTPDMGDEREVTLWVESMPCDGVLYAWGVAHEVRAHEEQELVLTAGQLRARVEGPALVFVGVDRRVEVGLLHPVHTEA